MATTLGLDMAASSLSVSAAVATAPIDDSFTPATPGQTRQSWVKGRADGLGSSAKRRLSLRRNRRPRDLRAGTASSSGDGGDLTTTMGSTIVTTDDGTVIDEHETSGFDNNVPENGYNYVSMAVRRAFESVGAEDAKGSYYGIPERLQMTAQSIDVHVDDIARRYASLSRQSSPSCGGCKIQMAFTAVAEEIPLFLVTLAAEILRLWLFVVSLVATWSFRAVRTAIGLDRFPAKVFGTTISFIGTILFLLLANARQYLPDRISTYIPEGVAAGEVDVVSATDMIIANAADSLRTTLAQVIITRDPNEPQRNVDHSENRRCYAMISALFGNHNEISWVRCKGQAVTNYLSISAPTVVTWAKSVVPNSLLEVLEKAMNCERRQSAVVEYKRVGSLGYVNGGEDGSNSAGRLITASPLGKQDLD